MSKDGTIWCSVCGAIMIHVAARSLRQDYIGRDAYIEYVRTHWVDASVTVPVAIVVGLLGLALLYRAFRHGGGRG